MNSIQFIQTHGWDEAKYLVEEWDGLTTTHWDMDCGFVNVIDSDTYYTDMNHLDQLVKSWELVESFFNINSLGFAKCIEIAKKEIEELESNGAIEFWHRWDDELSCKVKRMKQAIEDLESVEKLHASN